MYAIYIIYTKICGIYTISLHKSVTHLIIIVCMINFIELKFYWGDNPPGQILSTVNSLKTQCFNAHISLYSKLI